MPVHDKHTYVHIYNKYTQTKFALGSLGRGSLTPALITNCTSTVHWQSYWCKVQEMVEHTMNIIHLLCNEKLGNFKVFFSAGQIETA